MMRRCNQLLVFVLFLLFNGFVVKAESRKDTLSNYSSFKRSVSFSGLMQMRLVQSLNSNVDINGKHFEEGGITNTFALKRIRFQTRAAINDQFDAVMLINLADFNGNPQNKVLENAFIGYHPSKAFNMQFGQFRPYFGPEDVMPADFLRSLDYSNQYYAFCASAWQGFQIGASIYGGLKLGKLPFNYYVGSYNGNNRNQASDNDNQKNYYARMEILPVKTHKIGLNIASGSSAKKKGSAWGIDTYNTVKLSKSWQLDIWTEFKDGTNFAEFASQTLTGSISNYRMRGFYIYPDIKLKVNHPRIRSVEFSPRYEYLDENYKLTSNVRQTLTPTVSVEFSDDYFARLQLGVIMEFYDHDIPLTTRYSHNTAVAQLQVRF